MVELWGRAQIEKRDGYEKADALNDNEQLREQENLPLPRSQATIEPHLDTYEATRIRQLRMDCPYTRL